MQGAGVGCRGAAGSTPGGAPPARLEAKRLARGMGCGPSQAAEDQGRVPAPRKGWEEGFKVKQTNTTDKQAQSLLPRLGGGATGADGAGSAGAHSPPGGWLGRGGSHCLRRCLRAVLPRTHPAIGLALRAFWVSRTWEGGPTQGRGRSRGWGCAFCPELGLVVILRGGWEFLGAAVLYWLPESGPFENHLALKEIGGHPFG